MALGVLPNCGAMWRARSKTSAGVRPTAWQVARNAFWATLAGFIGGPIMCHFGLLLCCGMHVFVWWYPLEFAISGAVVALGMSLAGALWGREKDGLWELPDWMELPGFVVLASLLALGWRFGMPPLVTTYAPGAAQDLVFITKSGGRYHRAYCDYLPAHPTQTSRQAARLLGLTGCQACRAAARP